MARGHAAEQVAKRTTGSVEAVQTGVSSLTGSQVSPFFALAGVSFRNALNARAQVRSISLAVFWRGGASAVIV